MILSMMNNYKELRRYGALLVVIGRRVATPISGATAGNLADEFAAQIPPFFEFMRRGGRLVRNRRWPVSVGCA